MTLTAVATITRPIEVISILDSDDETPAPTPAPLLAQGSLRAPRPWPSHGDGDIIGPPPAKRMRVETTAVASGPGLDANKHLPVYFSSTATTPKPSNPPAPLSVVSISSDDDDDSIAPTSTAGNPTPPQHNVQRPIPPRPRSLVGQRGPYRMRVASHAALTRPTAAAPPRPAFRPPTAAPRPPKSRIPPTSPANFRARGRALQLQAVNDIAPQPSVLQEGRRPYLKHAVRAQLVRENKHLHTDAIQNGTIIHADFTADEIDTVAQSLAPGTGVQNILAVAKGYGKALKQHRSRGKKELVSETLDDIKLPGRETRDIVNFLADVAKYRRWNQLPIMMAPETDILDQGNRCARNAKFFSLVAARQVLPLGSSTLIGADAIYRDIRNGIRNVVEDELELRLEWTNAAGDIITTSWVSNNAFICGATSHSDAHNQQYNKPGNLLLGSATQKTVHAYPDHKIKRPIVQKGSNSSDEMIESQDPWLYSSVVYSDYDGRYNRAYTASFDHTVKVWGLTDSALKLLGTWEHTGNVNYVLASKHPSGMVATAANAASDAVRIYSVNDGDVSASSYRPFSAPLAEGAATEKWAYFPSTIRWGLAAGTPVSPGSLHLLLVGYSPRSLTGDDNDIPEDKRQSGELKLWDGLTGEHWFVSSASKCNVFDVAWHPSQECFIAATSPTGTKENSTRTQIRVYNLSKDHRHTYSETKTLDCTAVDINSLTIMPYCPKASYVTAGCTDGKTYVWDTGSQEALPFQILAHGAPIEEPEFGDIETGDVGVQFQAWGSSPDRFYTGSSDGTVRVWNVRTEGKPLIRVLLECPGAVTSGAFSPDKTKLVIGDGTGRVFLLTTHDYEEDEWGGASNDGAVTKPATSFRRPSPFSALPGQPMKIRTEDGGTLTRRRPTPIILHPEPPKPTHDAAGNPIEPVTGVDRGRAFLRVGQLVLHPNRVVGAVQGPNYDSTNLFCLAARTDPTDRTAPLRAADASRQQFALRQYSPVLPFRSSGGGDGGGGAARRDERVRALAVQRHVRNLALDLDVDALDEKTKARLGEDAVALGRAPDFDFEYAELPDEV